MTIQEIRNAFLMRYQRISKQQNQAVDFIGDKEIAFYISAAQQDIQRRIQVIESTDTITLGSGSSDYYSANTYTLPSNFGKHKKAYFSNYELEEKPLAWLERAIAEGDSGYWYAIKPSGHTSYLICPLTSGSITLQYYPDLNYYQPSLSSSQSWGTFDGVTYTGNLLLPDRYNMAILYNMLSQVFPDYLMMYEKELKSLRESRLFSEDYKLGYNLGIEEDTTGRASSSSSTEVVSITSLDAPIKRLRFTADDTGAYSVEFDSGWTTTPTIVNSVSSIVISSASSEFTNFIEVGINNEDFSYSQTGATTITITPTPSSGWGEAQVIINIYE